MIDILTNSGTVLTQAGFTVDRRSIGGREVLVFEDSCVLGFLFGYLGPSELMKTWEKDADRIVAANQFGLRRAAQKSWNAYVVLLAAGVADDAQSVALAAIEEDLRGRAKLLVRAS